IDLKNTSSITLNGKAITISRNELSNIPDSIHFPLLLSQQGDTIPAQLDDLDGDGEWDELFFLVDLPANGEKEMKLKWISSEIDFQKKTSVRFGVRASMDSKVEPSTSHTFYADMLPG